MDGSADWRAAGAAVVTAADALAAFQEATGLRVFAVYDRDSDAIWWAEDDRPDVFACSVGDRVLHIDELSPTPRSAE